jgi:hypothetical protein
MRSSLFDTNEFPLGMFNVLKNQYEASISSPEVFTNILNSESNCNNLNIHMEQTNSPSSKTRNALIIRSVYPSIKDWERELLSNPFYNL